jgi:hypothetical protein
VRHTPCASPWEQADSEGPYSGAHGGTSLAALVPVRTRCAESRMVQVLALSAPGAFTTMRGPALCWTASRMTATQRLLILESPRERVARFVHRSHLLQSWENTRVSPRALPALAEVEEGSPPWRGGAGRGDERGTLRSV